MSFVASAPAKINEAGLRARLARRLELDAVKTSPAKAASPFPVPTQRPRRRRPRQPTIFKSVQANLESHQLRRADFADDFQRAREMFPPRPASRTSASFHSTQRGSRFKICRHASGVSVCGRNRNAHDSVAVVSSNLRNGGVQYVGERSVVSVSTSMPNRSAK